MRLPNKVITYNESIISKFPIILSELCNKDYSVNELYVRLQNYFSDINDYLDALDCLYAMNKIEINDNTMRLNYVKRNNL